MKKFKQSKYVSRKHNTEFFVVFFWLRKFLLSFFSGEVEGVGDGGWEGGGEGKREKKKKEEVVNVSNEIAKNYFIVNFFRRLFNGMENRKWLMYLPNTVVLDEMNHRKMVSRISEVR